MFEVLFIEKERYWRELFPTHIEALTAFEQHRGPAFIYGPSKGEGLIFHRLEEPK